MADGFISVFSDLVDESVQSPSEGILHLEPDLHDPALLRNELQILDELVLLPFRKHAVQMRALEKTFTELVLRDEPPEVPIRGALPQIPLVLADGVSPRHQKGILAVVRKEAAQPLEIFSLELIVQSPGLGDGVDQVEQIAVVLRYALALLRPEQAIGLGRGQTVRFPVDQRLNKVLDVDDALFLRVRADDRLDLLPQHMGGRHQHTARVSAADRKAQCGNDLHAAQDRFVEGEHYR